MKNKKIHIDEDDERYKKFKRLLERACKDETLINMMRSMARAEIYQFHSKQGGESSPESTHPETRNFELRIFGELPATIFTNNKIETVSKELLRVQLVDGSSKELVDSGPLSSSKIRIVPLKGSFDKESWNATEFRSNIVAKRESKGDLLGGQLTVTLKSGVGYISNAFFTDTSLRQKLRIGVHSLEQGSLVKEAVSAPFVVKDRRGEQYKKHYPPKYDDAVWRLEGIGKDGPYHKRLTANGVSNVGDFVIMLETEPIRLRQILEKIGDGLWNQVEQHARSCEEANDYCFIFEIPEQGFHLVFDSLYRMQGWRSSDQYWEQLNNFHCLDQSLVNGLKKQAYSNKEAFVKIDKYQLFGPSNSPNVVASERCDAASSNAKTEPLRVIVKFLMAWKAAKARRVMKPKCIRSNSFGFLTVN